RGTVGGLRAFRRYAIVPGVLVGARNGRNGQGKMRTFMRFRTPFAAPIAAMILAAIPGTGSLAQTVTLKLHHYVPAQSNQQKFWFEPWAKKLEQESGGRLKVEIYPSMQLGGRQPQLFDQAKDGVVDIVWTVAGTTPGRFPRLEVFELPFLSHAIGEKTAQAVWDFYQAYAKDEL